MVQEVDLKRTQNEGISFEIYWETIVKLMGNGFSCISLHKPQHLDNHCITHGYVPELAAQMAIFGLQPIRMQQR